ncbi:HD domain-containing protein [Vibrio sp. SCSIO 43133]|uniref:HD domain-containing protein n=1 Tax=Vibrio sp. SCSIO 43133 TaxID=2802577 RepID=UPI0020766785|nr:HD domain-containing protein [Vibrio sp. SCSIO 43133]USE01758.1 HD domain-containing protein [Vibrio sp. SCSIO 43133]
MTRLEQQLNLLMELDKLKAVLRRTRVRCADGRFENSAEHSWHVAMMALLLQEHANEPVDIAKVVKMLLLHDMVEIDAGDTFVYDTAAYETQQQTELEAAKRLFGMLPDDQGEALFSVWREFEAAESAEARFAKALDRLIPMLLNYQNDGQSWIENNVSKQQVMQVNQRIEKGSQVLWDKAKLLIEEATENGWLRN